MAFPKTESGEERCKFYFDQLKEYETQCRTKYVDPQYNRLTRCLSTKTCQPHLHVQWLQRGKNATTCGWGKKVANIAGITTSAKPDWTLTEILSVKLASIVARLFDPNPAVTEQEILDLPLMYRRKMRSVGCHLFRLPNEGFEGESDGTEFGTAVPESREQEDVDTDGASETDDPKVDPAKSPPVYAGLFPPEATETRTNARPVSRDRSPLMRNDERYYQLFDQRTKAMEAMASSIMTLASSIKEAVDKLVPSLVPKQELPLDEPTLNEPIVNEPETA